MGLLLNRQLQPSRKQRVIYTRIEQYYWARLGFLFVTWILVIMPFENVYAYEIITRMYSPSRYLQQYHLADGRFRYHSPNPPLLPQIPKNPCLDNPLRQRPLTQKTQHRNNPSSKLWNLPFSSRLNLLHLSTHYPRKCVNFLRIRKTMYRRSWRTSLLYNRISRISIIFNASCLYCCNTQDIQTSGAWARAGRQRQWKSCG